MAEERFPLRQRKLQDGRTSNELAIVLRELHDRVRVVERELALCGLRGVL